MTTTTTMANNSTSATVTTIACGAIGGLLLAFHRWMKRPKCPNAATSDNPTKEGFSTKKIPSSSNNLLDVIVIGSGIGGLSTAAILAKEGKKVLVLEQHDVAGGNLHTFTERGYEFDTGLHYIGGEVGMKKKNSSELRKQFDYITDGGVEWEAMDDAYDIAISGNDAYKFCGDWTKLKKELKASFPEEVVAIDEYFNLVHHTVKYIFPLHVAMKMLLSERMSKLCSWILGRHLGIIKKTTKEVLESLTTNPKLVGVLSYHYGDYGETPSRGAFLMHALIAAHYRSGAYYPVGGPSKIAESIVHVIERWGGKVLVRAPVSSILIDDKNCAYGVVVKGKEILAKSVVSSVGAPVTMTKLIPETHRSLVGKYIDIMRDDENVASNISLMSMFVGIDDPDGKISLPKSNYWIHASWDHDANMEEYKKDMFKLPAFFISFSSAKDPTYSARHPGKHVALVIGPCSYDDVEDFENDRVKHRGAEYVAMKNKWKGIFTKVLLDQFPQLEGKIDHTEFGTAVTNNYYLGTHRGAVYGLAHTPKRLEQHWLRPKTPIKNLFLSGQDVVCCGVTGALAGGYMCAYAMSGRAFLHTMSLWTK